MSIQQPHHAHKTATPLSSSKRLAAHEPRDHLERLPGRGLGHLVPPPLDHPCTYFAVWGGGACWKSEKTSEEGWWIVLTTVHLAAEGRASRPSWARVEARS